MRIKVYNLGRKSYREVLPIQKYFLENKKNCFLEEDILILVEHNPVITIGRSGSRNDVLASTEFLQNNNIDILEVERGGKVTYHGPGQLVAYPIFDFKKICKDAHKIIRMYEETIIDFLKNYDITGKRIEGLTGIWINGRKIASIGIAISSWITFHGIAINTGDCLRNFSLINPCGLSFESITSISDILNRKVDMTSASINLINSFEKIFNSDIINVNYGISELVEEKSLFRK